MGVENGGGPLGAPLVRSDVVPVGPRTLSPHFSEPLRPSKIFLPLFFFLLSLYLDGSIGRPSHRQVCAPSRPTRFVSAAPPPFRKLMGRWCDDELFGGVLSS